MASKGTALRPIRVPHDLYEQILAEIKRTNPNRVDEAFNFSSWMLRAAREKLAHSYRSRTYRRKGRAKRPGKTPARQADEVLPGFDAVAQSLGYEPIGDWEVTESEHSVDELYNVMNHFKAAEGLS